MEKQPQYKFEFVLSDIEDMRRIVSNTGYDFRFPCQMDFASGVKDSDSRIFLTLYSCVTQAIKRTDDYTDDYSFVVVTDKKEIFTVNCEMYRNNVPLLLGIQTKYVPYREIIMQAIYFYCNYENKAEFKSRLREKDPEFSLYHLKTQREKQLMNENNIQNK